MTVIAGLGDDFISESSDVLSIQAESYIPNTESVSSFVLSMQGCTFKISSKFAKVAKVANSKFQVSDITRLQRLQRLRILNSKFQI